MKDLSQQPVRSIAKPQHKRRVKHRADRGKFSETVRKKIKKHFDDICQECGGIGIHIHHVRPKGSGTGRGVFTNGLLLCKGCHDAIHAELDQTRLKYWQQEFTRLYGLDYYKDQQDLEQGALRI